MREKTLKLEINDQEYTVTINEFSAYEAVVTVNGKSYTVGLKDLGIEQVSDLQPETTVRPTVSTPIPSTQTTAAPVASEKPTIAASDAAVVAPLPGLILKIKVNAGDTVKAGQVLLVMEAMKMENDVQAATDGTIKSIAVKEGDSVNEGDVLIEMA